MNVPLARRPRTGHGGIRVITELRFFSRPDPYALSLPPSRSFALDRKSRQILER